jgi:hypothetical protein
VLRMNLSRFIVFGAMLMICSCSTTPIIGSLSPQAGKRQAERDFAAGKPQIYLAGGFGSYEPGISPDQESLVAKLPRNPSMTGCTNPKAQDGDGYAKAYNQEIIVLLQSDHANK